MLSSLSARDPDDAKAVIYGFLAMGAFVCGGIGYLTGVLSTPMLVFDFVAMLFAFALHRHHLEGP